MLHPRPPSGRPERAYLQHSTVTNVPIDSAWPFRPSQNLTVHCACSANTQVISTDGAGQPRRPRYYVLGIAWYPKRSVCIQHTKLCCRRDGVEGRRDLVAALNWTKGRGVAERQLDKKGTFVGGYVSKGKPGVVASPPASLVPLSAGKSHHSKYMSYKDLADNATLLVAGWHLGTHFFGGTAAIKPTRRTISGNLEDIM